MSDETKNILSVFLSSEDAFPIHQEDEEESDETDESTDTTASKCAADPVCEKCGCGSSVSIKSMYEAAWNEPAVLEKASMDKDTKRFVDAVGSTFRQQAMSVVKRLRKAKTLDAGLVADIQKLLSQTNWRADVVTALAPFMEAKVLAGIDDGTRSIRAVSQIAAQRVPRPDLEAYARSESVRLARQIGDTVTETTAVRIGEIMQNGLAEGASPSTLADIIQDWAVGKEDEVDFTRSRALTIARTESARAQGLAKSKTWEMTDLVQGKKWLLAPDACPFCDAASKAFDEGQDLNKPFFKRGDVLMLKDGSTMMIDYDDVVAPPLHPNCRCDMIPVVNEDYEELFDELRAESEARRQAYLEELDDANG